MIFAWLTHNKGDAFRIYFPDGEDTDIYELDKRRVSSTSQLEHSSLCIIETCLSPELKNYEECISQCISSSKNSKRTAHLRDTYNKDTSDIVGVSYDAAHAYEQDTSGAADYIRPVDKRQIDPLQSCIEAKCSGVLGYKYGDCVFTRCVMGMGLSMERKKKSTWDDVIKELEDEAASKKSWNDVMSTCVEFHCAGMAPGTMDYTVCVHSNCGRIAYGKRWLFATDLDEIEP